MSAPRLNQNAIIRRPNVATRVWRRWGLKYLVAFILVALLSAVAFRIAVTFKSGLVLGYAEEVTPGFCDCLYFSIVTISSLGYGDIRPIGCGRVIASIEVTAGLVLIGLWISAMASSRLELLTERLHGHAVDERFKQFRANIVRLSSEFADLAQKHGQAQSVDSARLWSVGKDSEDAVMDELYAAVWGIVRHLRREVSEGEFFETTSQRFTGRLLGACIESLEHIAVASRSGGVLDASNPQAEGNLKRLRQVLHDYQVIADCMLHNSPHEEHRVAGTQLAAGIATLNA